MWGLVHQGLAAAREQAGVVFALSPLPWILAGYMVVQCSMSLLASHSLCTLSFSLSLQPLCVYVSFLSLSVFSVPRCYVSLRLLAFRVYMHVAPSLFSLTFSHASLSKSNLESLSLFPFSFALIHSALREILDSSQVASGSWLNTVCFLFRTVAVSGSAKARRSIVGHHAGKTTPWAAGRRPRRSKARRLGASSASPLSPVASSSSMLMMGERERQREKDKERRRESEAETIAFYRWQRKVCIRVV